jgi:hypothetical protein
MPVCYFYDSTKPVPFNYLTPSRMVGELPPPYDTTMSPNVYLEFAIADYAEGSQRGLVNAFGNAKRALHFTIDILLNQYGLFHHFGKSNFPTKLQLSDDIGILPITIMKNLNVERNLIEHEYDTPPENRVAEAIDVVKLLLLATEKLLERTPHEVVVGWKNPKRHILIQLEPISGELRLFTLQAKGRYRKSHGISHFPGPLRNFSEGKLLPGIKIPKSPWRIINLNKAQTNEWKPILAELINVQRKRTMFESIMNVETAEVTIPVTIPLPTLTKKPLPQILDEMIEKRFEEGAASKQGAEHKEKATNASDEIESAPKGAA